MLSYEAEFTAFHFVCMNKSRIAYDLHIKYLNEPTVCKTLSDFLTENADYLKEKYKSESDYNTNEFYCEVIKVLRTAQKQGKSFAMTADEYIQSLEEKLCHNTRVS